MFGYYRGNAGSRAPSQLTLWMVAVLLLTLALPAGHAVAASRKLNGPLVAVGGDVKQIEVGDDERTIFYTADHSIENMDELYMITADSATAVKLNAPLDYQDVGVASFLISPAGDYVVYRATSQQVLYSVPLTSGKVVRLSPPLDSVFQYFISPDGSHVVYLEKHGNAPFALYSVPIAGGSPTSLSDPAAGAVQFSIAISADSSRVVYLQGSQLYSVPIGGGTPMKFPRP